MPHLALPSLAAYLRPRGIEVIQRDLNLEIKDKILTRGYLRRVVSDLRRMRGKPSSSVASLPEGLLKWALDNGPDLAERVENAKAVMRGARFFEGLAGQNALETIVDSLQLASAPFYPTSLEMSSLIHAPHEYESVALLTAVRDPRLNPFLDLFRHGIMRDLERERPELVGISIPTSAQMLAGMTLAYLIKESGLNCHVTLGGPHITVLREQLPKVPELFDLFDSAILFDGEVPLLRLAEALSGDGKLGEVPSLVYKSGREVCATERGDPLPMDELPTPDFRGLPLDRYLAPGLVLPMATSRGCYHHRCAFCNVEDGLRPSLQASLAWCCGGADEGGGANLSGPAHLVRGRGHHPAQSMRDVWAAAGIGLAHRLELLRAL